MDTRPNIKFPLRTHERLVALADKEGRTITAQVWYLLDFYEKVAPQIAGIDARITKLEIATKASHSRKKSTLL